MLEAGIVYGCTPLRKTVWRETAKPRFDGDLARKKVTFNSGTFSGPPGLENLDKSKPMCPFEKTRKAPYFMPISVMKVWYWVVSSCFFMFLHDVRLATHWERSESLGVGWVRYVPLEEDLAWCRSTASGSAPESSEEEVFSEALNRWTWRFLDGYPGIPGRSWDKMVRNNEPKLEKGLQTPSEFERKKTMSNSYGLARSAALALGKLLHSIPKRFCRQKGRSRTSSTMRTWMCVCPADRIS